jgi:hypothetical protein
MPTLLEELNENRAGGGVLIFEIAGDDKVSQIKNK